MKRLAAALAPYYPGLRGAPLGFPFTLDERTLAQGMNFAFPTDFVDIRPSGRIVRSGPVSGIDS
jgi:hypothetical protein